MPTSRFVVACALEEEDDMRLALSEAEQRDLLNRVNRILLVLEDLMEPLPGSDVTAMEALSFLYLAARDFQTQRDSREPSARASVMTGRRVEERVAMHSVSCSRLEWERIRACAPSARACRCRGFSWKGRSTGTRRPG